MGHPVEGDLADVLRLSLVAIEQNVLGHSDNQLSTDVKAMLSITLNKDFGSALTKGR